MKVLPVGESSDAVSRRDVMMGELIDALVFAVGEAMLASYRGWVVLVGVSDKAVRGRLYEGHCSADLVEENFASDVVGVLLDE